MRLYVGSDLHSSNTYLGIKDEAGKLIFNAYMEAGYRVHLANPAEIQKYSGLSTLMIKIEKSGSRRTGKRHENIFKRYTAGGSGKVENHCQAADGLITGIPGIQNKKTDRIIPDGFLQDKSVRRCVMPKPTVWLQKCYFYVVALLRYLQAFLVIFPDALDEADHENAKIPF